MKTRIEFYIGTEMIDIREWPMTPVVDMLVDLVNSVDDSSRVVIILRVMVVGDEDGFKYVVFCEDFEKWQRRMTESSRTGRTS